MSFDPFLLKPLVPEFKKLDDKCPDAFVAFPKFENAIPEEDLEKITPFLWDLADTTLRPTIFVGPQAIVTNPDGTKRISKVARPQYLLQFKAGQETEYLLWEDERNWMAFQQVAARAWNSLPEGMHIPTPLCQFTRTPSKLIPNAAEHWPNFVAHLLFGSSKIVDVKQVQRNHCTEVVYLKVGFFHASLLAIEKLLNPGSGAKNTAEILEQAPIPPSQVSQKRSTERGEGRRKLIAALTNHHQYAKGSCLNQEPVGNNELARLADVEESTASDFFKREFNGHAEYKA